jgi:putative inorganic carbon (HCO3(-)) transporter
MIYYAFLLFFVLEYVRPGSYIPGLDILRLNSLVPLSVIGGTLFMKTKVSNQDFLSEPNAKIILGLFGLIVLSVVTATVTMHAYTVMTAVFGYILIFWVICRQIHDVKRIKGVFKTLIFVHLVVAALNPVMFSDPDARHYVASGSFLGDGNDFALSVNLAIPFCLFLFFESKKWYYKALSASSLLLLVLCVIATKSRGGTLALGSVGLYYWLKSDRKVMMASIAATLVAIVLVSAPPMYFERMQHIADSEEGSAQGRLLAWGAGVKMALKSPLLGAGAGHFPITYGQFYRSRMDIPWQTAHSIYFLVLGELGFPGLAMLLTFIFYNLAANRRLSRDLTARNNAQAVTNRRLLACTSASLISFATGGAFLSAVYYPHMYVLAGLLAATRRVIREHDQESAREPGDVAQAMAGKLRPRPDAISPEWTPKHVITGSRLVRTLRQAND